MIKNKVELLTKGIDKKEDKIKAILDFIQRDIAYLAYGLINPKRPELTLEKQYGDCKSKSLLTIKMLECIDVAAFPVVVHTKGIDERTINSHAFIFDHEVIEFVHNGDTILFESLNFNIIRGDKIGLLGPNGVGKTTLLKVLLGELAPTSGTVKLGTRLDIAYFDQMRDQLDDEKTIVDIVGQGRDSIEINGKSRHILSYLSDFLFSAERARTPLKALSGGERNRVQLACLFSLPANILVMDEPTNDLDVETLELLETVLVEFDGTIILVSHDRDFMDNVVTSTLAFEGQGIVREYVGGYQDWIRQGGRFMAEPEPSSNVQAEPAPSSNDTSAAAKTAPAKAKKLSFKEQRELDEMPGLIDQLEQQQQSLQEETTAADFYQQEHTAVTEKLERLAGVTTQLEALYERWMELSDE